MTFFKRFKRRCDGPHFGEGAFDPRLQCLQCSFMAGCRGGYPMSIGPQPEWLYAVDSVRGLGGEFSEPCSLH